MCNKSNTISRNSQKNVTYLLVRFDSDAPRTEKSQNILHRKKSHPLRRSVSHFVVSSTIASQKYSQQIINDHSAKQPLLNHRKHTCVDVSEYARHWSHRDYSSAQTQWSVSLSCRHTSISQSYDATTIFTTHFSRRFVEDPFSTITVLEPHVTETSSSKENYTRHGFDSSCALRETGTCHHWIQPHQTGKTFISSVVLAVRRREQRPARSSQDP